MVKSTIALLRLAWERYRRDLKDRCFVDHPVLETLIEQDLSSWLQDIQRKLEEAYNPQPSRSCLIPKPGFMIRPGMTLEPADAVVYTFLVGQIFPLLQTECRGTDGRIDIAYRLSSKSNSKEWTSHDFKIWRQWRAKSLRGLKRNVEYVVTTDITGYYDNIPIDKLASELRLHWCTRGSCFASTEVSAAVVASSKRGDSTGLYSQRSIGKIVYDACR
jgi:hypothetical protein